MMAKRDCVGKCEYRHSKKDDDVDNIGSLRLPKLSDKNESMQLTTRSVIGSWRRSKVGTDATGKQLH